MTRAAAALALSASLALSACGQSAEQRFRTHELRPLRTQLEQRRQQFAALVGAAHPGRRRDARALTHAVDALATVSGRIAALRPPGSVRLDFERYASANRRLVSVLREFAIGVAERDRTRMSSASAGATRAAGEVRRAEDALDQALTG
ncbi:MAG: hypothetical protein ACJ76Z_05915 [Thermoleophilaceae bacterium]